MHYILYGLIWLFCTLVYSAPLVVINLPWWISILILCLLTQTGRFADIVSIVLHIWAIIILCTQPVPDIAKIIYFVSLAIQLLIKIIPVLLRKKD